MKYTLFILCTLLSPFLVHSMEQDSSEIQQRIASRKTRIIQTKKRIENLKESIASIKDRLEKQNKKTEDLDLAFLKTTTIQDLNERRDALYKAAAKNDVEQVQQIRQEYVRTIDLEICLQEIQCFDHNRDIILQRVQQLKTLARPVIYNQKVLYLALYHAINSGSYETTKELLSDTPDNFLQDKTGRLLHMVCFGNWHDNEAKIKEILELMLAKGANINQIRRTSCSNDGYLQTPLDVACGHDTFAHHKAPPSIQFYLQQRGARCVQQPAFYPNKYRDIDWGHPL